MLHDPTPVEFTSLPLDERIQRGIADRGFIRTTPIQSAVFRAVLEGIDVIAGAQTGTGKTAAFLLPIIQRLLSTRDAADSPARTGVTRVLVLAPTRELAVQIDEDFQGLAYHTALSSVAVYGGVDAGLQAHALRQAVDLVVATPGRLLDHMNSGIPRFEGLEVLVLDEADRMLDMGFWPSVRRIVAALPVSRQTLLFSATISPEVGEAASQLMRAPRTVQLGPTGATPATITHLGCHVTAAKKTTWLAQFLRRTPEPTIVFVRTKRLADRLATRLASSGVRCVALHADRTQAQRTAAVDGFRAGRYTTLVATDVAARGLDIDGIAYIVNHDVPSTADTYVHRVGRTGRADATGTALTLVAPEETEPLRAIERSLGFALASWNPELPPSRGVERPARHRTDRSSRPPRAAPSL